jgi:hypothetical protein
MDTISTESVSTNNPIQTTVGVSPENRGSNDFQLNKSINDSISKNEKEESTDSQSNTSGTASGEQQLQGGKLVWNEQTEKLLSSWADLGASYKWLHEQSFRSLSKTNSWYSIPCIILSTLSGSLNLSLQGYVPAQYITYATAGLGFVNIFVGILSTLQTKFRFAERSEAHNNVSAGWSKFQRDISIELSVAREHRKDADTFIRIKRNEYDRLLESSPVISEEIIEKFKVFFNKQQKEVESRKLKLIKKAKTTLPKKIFSSNTDQISQNINDIVLNIDDENDKLIVPDICGNISHTKVYREPKKEIYQQNGDQTPFRRKSLDGYRESQSFQDKINMEMETNHDTHEKSASYCESDQSKFARGSVLDRIKELDEKISGVNQYKLALAGQRLAPLASLIAESERYNVHRKSNNWNSDYRSSSIGNRGDYDSRLGEKIKPKWNSLTPLNSEYKDNISLPGFIEQNKEEFNVKQTIKSIQSVPRRSTIDISSIIHNENLKKKNESSFGSKINEIPKGKVKNLIGKFGTNKTEPIQSLIENRELHDSQIGTETSSRDGRNATEIESEEKINSLNSGDSTMQDLLDIENKLSTIENKLTTQENFDNLNPKNHRSEIGIEKKEISYRDSEQTKFVSENKVNWNVNPLASNSFIIDEHIFNEKKELEDGNILDTSKSDNMNKTPKVETPSLYQLIGSDENKNIKENRGPDDFRLD